LDVIVQIGAKADVERERKMGKKCGRDDRSTQLIFLPLEFLGYDVFEGGEPPPSSRMTMSLS
jgi:hypothetical protein